MKLLKQLKAKNLLVVMILNLFEKKFFFNYIGVFCK